ncbi:MAG: TonB-dependent receptor plug domain-containing protein [Flavobacterium sp.]
MKLVKTFALVCVLFLFHKNNAQTVADTIKTDKLKEVVITGTRTERDAASLPIPVQIISGETIQKTGISRLNEIIQEQTGIITVPDFGGSEGIQLQGLDAAYVMILIDGQPLMGRTAGTLDLSRITVNNIERIEIIKGASSSLYGSEALGGVINIITKKIKADNQLRMNVNYKLATFNTRDASVNVQYGKNKIGFELFGNHFSSDGYNISSSDYLQTVEPYSNWTFQPKLNVNFSDDFNLTVNSRLYSNTQDNKAIIGEEKYIGETRTNEWNNTILANHNISSKLKLVYDLYVTNYKADEFLNDSNNLTYDHSDYNQWFFRPELRSHYKIGKNTLTSGVGMNQETLNRTYFEQTATLSSTYLFSQYEWFIKQKWNVLLGFRYDNHNQYKSQFSPKVGVNYKLSDSYSLKSSVGYGYKAPDLRQLFFDFTNSTVGYTVLGYNVAEEKLTELQNQGQILFTNGYDFSAPLKPESSINVNFGGLLQKSKKSLEYNFFYNSISDLIDTNAIAQKTNGQNVFSYFNVNKVFTYGTELNSSYKISNRIRLSAGYQFLIAKDESVVGKIENGEIFARDPVTLSSFKLKSSDYFGLYNRSKHTVNFKTSYDIPSLKMNINARIFYRSKYGIADSNNNSVLDKYDNFVSGYFLANVAALKEFKSGIVLQAGVNNLLDYTDPNNISNLAGRQVFTRIQYNF